MGCTHVPVVSASDIIICRKCGVEIFFNKRFKNVKDAYLSHNVKFNVVKFMKENRGTIAENMTILDKDDLITYAMYIIRCQKKVIKKLKENNITNPLFKKLQDKIINQRNELSRLNSNNTYLCDNRKCISINQRFMKITHTLSIVSKVTINPCDGRVELKIAPQFTNEQVGIATKIIMMVVNYKLFYPYTYRGNIKIDKMKNIMYVNMRTESKIEEDVNFSIVLS